MNERKIAFILCMNNKKEYAECKRYLDRLVVPEGYETDIITIQEAPSMCAGYNAGMQSTDAKYKVYIHQDTFIINKNFIADMLKVFEDENVGLMGVIGARKLPKNAYAVTAWDTGKVYHNNNQLVLGYQDKDRVYTEVEALDGLLLATQYDIAYREDLFENFDFYDISCCMEYRRAGFKVVSANQDEPWVFHNNKYSKMVKYDVNRDKFIEEYGNDFFLTDKFEEIDNQAYEKAKIESIKVFEKLIDMGQIKAVSEMLNKEQEVALCLRDISILSRIYDIDKDGENFKWDCGVKCLYETLNEVKYFLKRVEYNVKMDEEEIGAFCREFSGKVLMYMAVYSCYKAKTVLLCLINYLTDRELVTQMIKNIPDSRMCDISGEENYEVFIKHKDRDFPICLHVDSNQEYMELLYEIICKLNLLDRVVICAANDCIGVKFFRNKGIPCISGAPLNLRLFIQEKDWKIDNICYTYKDEYVEECIRIFAKTDKKCFSLLELISENFNMDSFEYFYYLGKSVRNEKQAYLCMKQALYYCNQDEDRKLVDAELNKYCDVRVPKTSVVIISYNTKDMTKNTIDSIKKNTNPDDYEIIVIDNGSVDGSVDMLRLIDDITLIESNENKGFAGGCNIGIEKSTNNNDIWLLNSDTLVPKNALFWLRMGLYSNENVGATGSVSNFCPNYQNIVEADVIDKDYEKVALKYNVYKENTLEEKNWLVGFSMLIRREALEKTGYLDERFFPGNFEDNDLSYRLIENGYKLFLCHNSFVFHYGGTSFKNSNTVSSSLILNKERFIEKWRFDSEKYTEIKTRHISMIDRKRDEEFSVIDLNAGVGATIAKIKYIYKNAYVVGVEECTEAAEIANYNGCKVSNEVDRYFDYVLTGRLNDEILDDASSVIKYNGLLIGSHENKYYNELVMGENVTGLEANEIIKLLGSKGYKIIDFSYERGICDSKEKVLHLCKKYNCDEKMILARKYYFVAKLCH